MASETKHATGLIQLGGASGRMLTQPGYPGDGFIADVDTLANAQRLRDCWNACSGINPESVPLLLEALNRCSDYFHDFTEHDATETELAKVLREALAKAERGEEPKP